MSLRKHFLAEFNNNDSELEHSALEGRYSNASEREKSQRRVQFADIVGGALTSVKMITPANSEEDVSCVSSHQHPLNGKFEKTEEKEKRTCRLLRPLSASRNMDTRNVCLEELILSWCMITGNIKVKNLAFAKEVTVRYTTDKWQTFQEVWADYIPGSSDGETDKFQFRVTVPSDFKVAGIHIEFAIRYRVAGMEFWDNNLEENYRIELWRS